MTRHELEKEICSFANIPEGWSFGEGGPISACVIQKSLLALRIFSIAQLEARAFPNLDGTIMLSFTHDESFFDITIGKDDLIELTHEHGIGSNYDEIACLNCTMAEALKYVLKKLRRAETCLSSESSTSDTSIRASSVLYPAASRLRQPTEESRSSLEHALTNSMKTKPLVSISNDTTPTSQGCRPYTGNFQPKSFLAGLIYNAHPQKQGTLATA